jgi:hypothetical protein
MYIGEEVRYLSLLYNAKSGILPHSVTAPVDASSFSASVSPSVVPCPILQSLLLLRAAGGLLPRVDLFPTQ